MSSGERNGTVPEIVEVFYSKEERSHLIGVGDDLAAADVANFGVHGFSIHDQDVLRLDVAMSDFLLLEEGVDADKFPHKVSNRGNRKISVCFLLIFDLLF
jgi:hypothetical protein